MRGKRIGIVIGVLAAVVLLVFLGYFFRIDRLGLSEIDWVDVVEIEGQQYLSDFSRVAVERSDVGQKIGEILFNVSDNVHNASYRFRDGDATYLEVGTEVYRLKSRDDAIAVKINESYFLYEAEVSR